MQRGGSAVSEIENFWPNVQIGLESVGLVGPVWLDLGVCRVRVRVICLTVRHRGGMLNIWLKMPTWQ